MRVLFYEDPVTDQSSFFWRAPHVELDAAWLNVLCKAGCDARMLVHQRFVPLAKRSGVPANALFAVDEESIVAGLPDPHLNINSLFQRMADAPPAGDDPDRAPAAYDSIYQAAVELLHDRVAEALGEFRPDIIITWVPVPHLRRAFPEALILHKETSLFSRDPYPRTYYLDPSGFGAHSAVSTMSGVGVSPNTVVHYHRLKDFLASAFEIFDRTADLRKSLQDFRRSVLVAGHTNGVFFFDAACDFRSQAHLLLRVLETVPSDTAVIATEHPDCRTFSAREVEYLRSLYPNLVHWPQLAERAGASQGLVRHVDMVATMSSSIASQAIFWGKPRLALDDSRDSRVSELGSSDQEPLRMRDFDAAWLCFHYSYPEQLALREGWLNSHLAEKLRQWRVSGLKGYFEQPITSVGEMEALYKSEIAMNTRQRIGDAFAKDEDERLIDLASLSYFGSGWGSPEHTPGGSFRWTNARRAMLHLPLKCDGGVELSIFIGNSALCDCQCVTAGVGDVQLAELTLEKDQHGELLVEIPSRLMGELATSVWIDASQSFRPTPHGPELSIGVGRIRLRKIDDIG